MAFKRYPLEDLKNLPDPITKSEIFKDLGETYDVALPQPWLDGFVKLTGLDYGTVLSTTVWVYDDLYRTFGHPVSCCTEVQAKIDVWERMGSA